MFWFYVTGPPARPHSENDTHIAFQGHLLLHISVVLSPRLGP